MFVEKGIKKEKPIKTMVANVHRSQARAQVVSEEQQQVQDEVREKDAVREDDHQKCLDVKKQI